MSQKWYCRFGGSVQGPFTVEVLKVLLREGQVELHTPVRGEASTIWMHLEEVIDVAVGVPSPPPVAAANKAAVGSGPPPPPPSRKTEGPPIKIESDPAVVLPRRGLGPRTSRDAQVWAWIGLVGALGVVGILLTLVLTGSIGPQFGAQPEAKNTSPVATDPVVEAGESPVENAASGNDPRSAKSTKSETPLPAKTKPERKPVDPLKSVDRWASARSIMRVRGRREEIAVPAMWFAWNDYGEPVGRFDMNDIAPADPADGKKTEEWDDPATESSESPEGTGETPSETSATEAPPSESPGSEDGPAPAKARRPPPRLKPEFLFVKVQIKRDRGGSPVEYRSWNGQSSPETRARLYDDQGREIPMIPPTATTAVIRFDKIDLPPGSITTDVLVFELPKHRFTKLRLVLPLAAIGLEASMPFVGFEFHPNEMEVDELGEVGARTEVPEESAEESRDEPDRPARKRVDDE